jgi:hypothetical protein
VLPLNPGAVRGVCAAPAPAFPPSPERGKRFRHHGPHPRGEQPRIVPWFGRISGLKAGNRAFRSNSSAPRLAAAGFRYFRFNPLRGRKSASGRHACRAGNRLYGIAVRRRAHPRGFPAPKFLLRKNFYGRCGVPPPGPFACGAAGSAPKGPAVPAAPQGFPQKKQYPPAPCPRPHAAGPRGPLGAYTPGARQGVQAEPPPRRGKPAAKGGGGPGEKERG